MKKIFRSPRERLLFWLLIAYSLIISIFAIYGLGVVISIRTGFNGLISTLISIFFYSFITVILVKVIGE